MKYIVLVGDGMADRPVPSLGNRTPLQVAKTPNLDFLAQHGIVGTAHTLIPGYPLGSDVANLAVMGYDPHQYYSGRAPWKLPTSAWSWVPRILPFGATWLPSKTA